MENKLKLRRLAIVPTTHCTLNCKLCSNYMTFFENNKNVSTDDIKRDIDNIFKLIDYIQWLQFVGGEIFMRKDMSDVYRYCFKYKDKFEKLIFMTNATLIPCDKDMEFLIEFKEDIQIHISDYGKYSYKLNEFKNLLDKHNISYVVKNYHGDSQYCGGWVDNNNFSDRGKSDEELKKQFNTCAQVVMENFHVYKGILQGCARSLFVSTLGKVIPARRDYVDLNDKSMSDDEKRYIIKHFNDSPRVSCKSCIGFNDSDDVPRYPAAEQI